MAETAEDFLTPHAKAAIAELRRRVSTPKDLSRLAYNLKRDPDTVLLLLGDYAAQAVVAHLKSNLPESAVEAAAREFNVWHGASHKAVRAALIAALEAVEREQ